MADFSMTKYYNEYIAAENEAQRLRQRVEGLRSALSVVPDEDTALELLERIRKAEEQYQTARAGADKLRCKALTGRSPEELPRDGSYQEIKRYGGGAKPHWPESPKGRLDRG